jgi:N-acyl-D-amino-acid deacylase
VGGIQSGALAFFFTSLDRDFVAGPATFEDPHQYATGVEQVFVNGAQVLAHGEHTGATPGRVVRGPGYSAGLPR